MNGESVVQGLSGALLVGLAGFLYLHSSYFQRFRHAPIGHQTRASLAFAYGLFFLFAAGLLAQAEFAPLAITRDFLLGVWVSITPVKSLSGVFGAAPMLALFAGLTSNIWRLMRASDRPYLKDVQHVLHTKNLLKRMRLAALGDVASSADDQMLWTMWRAITLGKLVQVTMKSRKVYVGSPLPLGDPSATSLWLKIMPIASGFRDAETLTYIPTTDYRILFEVLAESDRGGGPELKSSIKVGLGTATIEFDQADLGFLLPWSEVASITIHDPALEAFFSPDAAGEPIAEDDREITG